MEAPIIFWFRNDLRLQDNPALQKATEANKPIFFIYIHCHSEKKDHWSPGAASRWWLHHSLESLAKALRKHHSELYYFEGDAGQIIPALVEEIDAQAVYCNRVYEPAQIQQDKTIKTQLEKSSSTLIFGQGNTLFPPGSIRNKQNDIYKVFTPYYKACVAKGIPSGVSGEPNKITQYRYNGASISLKELHLLPKIHWYDGLESRWQPGENGAHQILQNFIQDNLADYSQNRDFPELDNTSHLSPHLHFGEIAAQRIVHELQQKAYKGAKLVSESDAFIRQLVWRDFATQILVSFPHTTHRPFQDKFNEFPWKKSNKALEKAWQQGQTGYPIIDAGMRELWHTGYMHNRVRMIVASFLTKNGLLHWIKGARWFWDTLVDADLAQNSMNWQWVAGSGVDAAPYFRIFNPVTQSKKFDKEGNYIRQWCPELESLPDKYLHEPWQAPNQVLEQAEITLGDTYPQPILDIKETREAALSLFKSL